MEKIGLESEAFEALRDDFNNLLMKTVLNMISKNSSEAVLTAKLNINLIRSIVIDESVPDGTREIIKPEFSHNVSSVMQIKSKLQGKTEGNYELVWNDLQKEFEMKHIDEQITLWD